jgi:hypothetical protein
MLQKKLIDPLIDRIVEKVGDRVQQRLDQLLSPPEGKQALYAINSSKGIDDHDSVIKRHDENEDNVVCESHRGVACRSVSTDRCP